MQVLQGPGTDRTLQKAIDNEESIVFTNKSKSYVNIADYVVLHISEKLGQTGYQGNLEVGTYRHKQRQVEFCRELS
jgi:hypothetical protein